MARKTRNFDEGYVAPAKIGSQELAKFLVHAEDVAPPAIWRRAQSMFAGGFLDEMIFSEDRKTLKAKVGSERLSFGAYYDVELNIEKGFKESSCECPFFQENPGIPCKPLVTLSIWAGSEGKCQVEKEDMLAKNMRGKRKTQSL